MSLWKVLSELSRRLQGPPPAAQPGCRWRPRIDSLEDRLCPAPYLLVSDANLNAVFRYNGSDGTPVNQFVPPQAGLTNPDLGLVVSPDGASLLVDGYGSHNVLRFNLADGSPNPRPHHPAGARFTPPAAKSGGLAGTEGIDFGPDGNLYVSNDMGSGTSAGPGDVLIYKGTTGKFLGVFVASGVGGMGRGNDLHWGPDGNLYVDNSYGDGQLLRYDSGGNPLPSGGRDGANFTDPVPGYFANGFAFGPDGNVYVAEANKATGAAQVLQYDANGNLLSTFIPAGSGGVRFIDSIRFGPDGNLYVADEAVNGSSGRVLEYSGQDGSFIGVFVDAGSGGIQLPAGLLFYDDGTGPAVHGRHADPTLASATVTARHADPALVTSAVTELHVPSAAPPAGTDAPVTGADAVSASAPVASHQANADAEPSALALVRLDLADLR